MKLLIAFLVLLLAPAGAGAQRISESSAPRLGASSLPRADTASQAPGHTAFKTNVIRGAAVGVVIGGVIGALNSRHQGVAAGFTHTPAALYVVTYGGLVGLLGMIGGALLPSD